MAAIVMGHVEHSDTNGLKMQNGGIVPPSLLQENRVPRFYKEAIAKCGASSRSQLPNTALVYNLMVTSCLPRHILGNIWSLVNRTMPGQLTRQEFFSCLALIALIQKGQPLSALSTMSTLPIPHLQACAPFKQHLPGRDIFQQLESFSTTCQATQKTPNSSGIAVNMLTVPTTSSAISLLADIDFSKPVSNSTNFAQPAAISGSEQGTKIPSSQSSNIMTDLDNHVLSKDTYESANSILQNFGSSNIIPNILEANSQIASSEAALLSIGSSTNADVDKTIEIPESVQSSGVHATMKFMASANKDREAEYLYIWRRCIEEAYALFSDADSLLPYSAAAHITEIAHTDRGARYLKALYEIHEMTLRIREGRIDKLVKQKKLLDKIDEIWARLECFTEKQLAEEVDKTIPSLCSICLLHVSLNSMLAFAGNIYHKQCANLWINRVDSFLPKLEKFSLL